MSFRRHVSHLRIGVASNSVQFDTSTILDDFLYLGAKGVTSNLEQLESQNISYVINCSSEAEFATYPPDFHYLHVRVDDSANAPIAQYFEQCCEFITRARGEDKAVLVHCTMGMSRSATIVLAYLVGRANMSLMDAFEYIKQRRPVASPNPGFMLQLVDYELKVRGKASIDPVKYDAKSRFGDAKHFARA